MKSQILCVRKNVCMCLSFESWASIVTRTNREAGKASLNYNYRLILVVVGLME